MLKFAHATASECPKFGLDHLSAIGVEPGLFDMGLLAGALIK